MCYEKFLECSKQEARGLIIAIFKILLLVSKYLIISHLLWSLLMAHASKYYISLKSFFFVRGWAGIASE